MRSFTTQYPRNAADGTTHPSSKHYAARTHPMHDAMCMQVGHRARNVLCSRGDLDQVRDAPAIVEGRRLEAALEDGVLVGGMDGAGAARFWERAQLSGELMYRRW